MNKNDRKLYKRLNENVSIPQIYTDTIYNTFDKLPESKNNFKKLNKLKLSIVTTCCSLILITGCVFGKEVTNYIKNFFNSSRGMDTAIQNGYIDTLNLNKISENSNIKINNYLMDELNLSLSILVKLDNYYDINNISKIDIGEMIITDESKNILHCTNKESFFNYIAENKLNYQFNVFNDNYINSSYNYYIKNKDYNNNTIEIICNFYSNGFPKSKKLDIKFKDMCIFSEDGTNNISIGNGNLKIDIIDKFYNREEIEYRVIKCSNPTLNITKASLYNTGFRLEFNAQFKPWYEENASEEEIQKAYEDFSIWKNKERVSSGKSISLVDNAYIENEIGKLFYPLKSSTEDTFIQYQTSGEFYYMQTFDMTQFDINSNKIKIYFSINLPYMKDNVVVELERK